MIAKRPRLALELTLALVAKMIALAIIWHVWFSDPEGQRTDGERVSAAVYSLTRRSRNRTWKKRRRAGYRPCPRGCSTF